VAANYALAALGPEAMASVPTLKGMGRSRDNEIRVAVEHALKRIAAQ
jgi:hypothetical protein